MLLFFFFLKKLNKINLFNNLKYDKPKVPFGIDDRVQAFKFCAESTLAST